MPNLRGHAPPLQAQTRVQGDHLDQDDVQLVQEDLLLAEDCLIGGELDDEVGDVIADALPLLVWQRTPPVLYSLLQDLHTLQLRDLLPSANVISWYKFPLNSVACP